MKIKFCSHVLIVTYLMTCLSFNSKADENDLYDFLWLDPDKTVYVLQNKVFKKDGSFYTDLSFLKCMTSSYQSTMGGQFRQGYFITEEWAIELIYTHYMNSNNVTYENLKAVMSSDPFIRKLESSYAALAIWSPFYGKINTFNQIYYFDWSFGIGWAQITAASNAETVTDPDVASSFASKTYNGIISKTDLKFYVTKHINVGMGAMFTSYKAKGPITNKPAIWRHTLDFILSVGFLY